MRRCSPPESAKNGRSAGAASPTVPSQRAASGVQPPAEARAADAAEFDDLKRGERHTVLGVRPEAGHLRQHADAGEEACGLAPTERVRVGVEHAQTAGGAQVRVERMHQRRLAGAVGPDDREKGTARQRKRS